jgi:hypothetical protein
MWVAIFDKYIFALLYPVLLLFFFFFFVGIICLLRHIQLVLLESFPFCYNELIINYKFPSDTTNLSLAI